MQLSRSFWEVLVAKSDKISRFFDFFRTKKWVRLSSPCEERKNAGNDSFTVPNRAWNMGLNEHRMIAVTFSSAEKMDLENRVFWSQKGRFWSIFEAISKCVECLQVQFFALRLLYYSCRLQWRRPEVFICLQKNLRTLWVFTQMWCQIFVKKMVSYLGRFCF